LVVDKTGTLTEGRPRLTTIEVANGFDEFELLRLVASLERASEHPLGAAIVDAVKERSVELVDVGDFNSITGQGVVGTVDGRRIAIGNTKLMEREGVSLGDLEQRAEGLRGQGTTVLFAAIDGSAAGLLGVSDPIKSSTPQAIETLHAMGLKIIMLTGDSEATRSEEHTSELQSRENLV